MTTKAIGIDLGTTHSCVAVYENDKPKVISNDCGSRTTPSWVSFDETECLIGEPARNQAPHNPENTVYDMKRLIGRWYEDPTVQSDIMNWPFKVICDNGLPKVSLMYKGVAATFTPEEISAMILTKMKETAEQYLEEEVTKAVITVPAYFSDYQREATMNAAKIANLEVLRLLNEPTAAAVAYVFSKAEVNGTLLVVDIGGGTLDVSIVAAEGSEFTVKATNGNTHLGGEDFTNKLTDYMIDLFKEKHNKDIKTNNRALSRLRQQCEVAKKTLSFSQKVTVCVDGILDGIDLHETINRDKYDAINADLFDCILQTVEKTLVSSDIAKETIDKVIMVGGSSRIPKLQNILHTFFNKEIYASINSDEAIAQGACIYAAIHNGIDVKGRKGFTIRDIIPMSLGVAIGKYCHALHIILDKHSILPISKITTYTTSFDNQTIINFHIYEGEEPTARKNKCLGRIKIRGIPPKPKREETVNVTFSIDRDGILKVSAKSVSTGTEVSAVIDRRF